VKVDIPILPVPVDNIKPGVDILIRLIVVGFTIEPDPVIADARDAKAASMATKKSILMVLCAVNE